jgi:hypothetical protein
VTIDTNSNNFSQIVHFPLGVSSGSVRGNRSPVAVVVVEAAVVVGVVVAGLGLAWDRAALLLGHRPVRRLLRTWQGVEEEEHP